MQNTIQLNGDHLACVGQTVAQLVAHIQPQAPFAVALNTTFVPKGQYSATVLQAGDVVDIVNPIVGG